MDLKLILERHKKWLKNDVGGERADLSGANLRGVNFSGACLRGADLSGADLSGADLSGANLRGVNFSGVDLSGADLSGACLRGAELRWANLRGEHNNKYIEPYEVIYIENFIVIGCKTYSREEWKNFLDETIATMAEGALVWWKKNKKHVLGGGKK